MHTPRIQLYAASYIPTEKLCQGSHYHLARLHPPYTPPGSLVTRYQCAFGADSGPGMDMRPGFPMTRGRRPSCLAVPTC